MDNELVPKDEKKPSVPGIGVSGTVMCPFGFQKTPCLKQGCELWVELDSEGTPVGRCSLAWLTILSTEVRGSIDRLRQAPTTEVKEK